MKNNNSVNRAGLCTQTQNLALHEILTYPDRGELFGINFEFKWKQPATKDFLANNFIMLNRFWSLSKNPFTSHILPNTNEQ